MAVTQAYYNGLYPRHELRTITLVGLTSTTSVASSPPVALPTPIPGHPTSIPGQPTPFSVPLVSSPGLLAPISAELDTEPAFGLAMTPQAEEPQAVWAFSGIHTNARIPTTYSSDRTPYGYASAPSTGPVSTKRDTHFTSASALAITPVNPTLTRDRGSKRCTAQTTAPSATPGGPPIESDVTGILLRVCECSP
ncbi:hypothetical protein BJV78DRAFT_920506 [Lactifluus subvellereus]|nr:hypothetical protein BJV78DRAFT_920506 [Lactifluus subvellereus]